MRFCEWLEKLPEPEVKKQPFRTFSKAKRLALSNKDLFQEILKLCSEPDHRTKVSIKSEKSFKNKTEFRGKSPAKVFDVLRGAILVNNKEETDDVVSYLKQICDVQKVEHKDGNDEFGYAGPVHVNIILNGMVCEIIVTTKKFWKYKGMAHKLYLKYRGKNIPQEVKDKTKELCRKGNAT